MNVLLLADMVDRTGVGNYIKMLSTKLVENGDDVIVASEYCNLDLSDKVRFVKMYPINMRPDYLMRNVFVLRKILRESNVDIVHANHRMSAFLMRMYNLFFVHVPTIWTSHLVTWPMNPLKKLLGYYGDISVAISSEGKKFMQENLCIPEKKIVTIYNGVDYEYLQPLSDDEKVAIKRMWQIKSDKIVIAVHGRIAYSKGIDFLIDVISHFTENERAQLQIICSGQYKNNAYYNKIADKIAENKLEDTFKFVGWCKTRDILGVSDLMIQPSRIEGFPLAAAEAFIMGVPLIRTKTGGYEDMKDICVGVEFGDIDTLLVEIRSFLESPDKYRDMAQNAKKKALECFTLDTMFEATYNTYKKTISVCNN